MANEVQTPGTAARVFGTFELLERVLISIRTSPNSDDRSRHTTVINHAEEIKALFRLQRVNTTFRDVINRSITLRMIMFKNGITEDSMHDNVHAVKVTRSQLNPLIDQLFSSVIRSNTYFWLTDAGEDNACEVNIYITALDFIEMPMDSMSWPELLVIKEEPPWNLDISIRYTGHEDSACNVKVESGATLSDLAVTLVQVVNLYVKRTRRNLGQRR